MACAEDKRSSLLNSAEDSEVDDNCIKRKKTYHFHGDC